MFFVQVPCCRPEPTFFVAQSEARGLPMKRHTERNKGSLGTGVPRNDTVGGCHPEPTAEDLPLGTLSRTKCLMGRRPERSEGCLASLGRTKERLLGRTE